MSRRSFICTGTSTGTSTGTGICTGTGTSAVALLLPSLLSLAILCLVGQPAAQSRLYVDAAVAASGDGSTWGKAFKTLGEALTAAGSGAHVWVAAGVYPGGFSIPSGVAVYGGLASGDARLTERDVGDKPVVLDGGGIQRVLSMAMGSTVDGCFIQNGRAGAPGGAGLVLLGVDCTVRNCGFLDNNITAGRGSAVYLGRDSNARGANPLFENCVFVGNGKATNLGHVIDIEGSSGIFRNVLVDRNHDNGLHMQGGSSTAIYNSAFTNNTGRGLCHIDAATTPLFENNLIWNNTVSLYHYRGKEYQTIAAVNALAYAKNNISADPRWTAPAMLDYSLLPASPMIDAGQDIPGAAVQDVDGNVRRLDGDINGMATTDIGPVEFANVYIEYLGTARPGNVITIDSHGKQGTPMFMAIGLQPMTTPFFLPQLGTVLVDLTLGAIHPWAPVDTAVNVTIPTNTPVGVAVLFQAAAGVGNWGNLSNPMDVRIRL